VDPEKAGVEPAHVSDEPSSQDSIGAKLKVQIGDLVVIRYDDEPARPVRIRLSDREHKPDIGVIHVNQPLATAVLGKDLEDEIEVAIGGKLRQGVIEHVERAALATA
jgi:transcription elongation GreA/GreB family factor